MEDLVEVVEPVLETERLELEDPELVTEVVLEDVTLLLTVGVDVPDFDELGLLDPLDEAEEVLVPRLDLDNEDVLEEVLVLLGVLDVVLLLVVEAVSVPDGVELRELLGLDDELDVPIELLVVIPLLVELLLRTGVTVPTDEGVNDLLDVPVFVDEEDPVVDLVELRVPVDNPDLELERDADIVCDEVEDTDELLVVLPVLLVVDVPLEDLVPREVAVPDAEIVALLV